MQGNNVLKATLEPGSSETISTKQNYAFIARKDDDNSRIKINQKCVYTVNTDGVQLATIGEAAGES